MYDWYHFNVQEARAYAELVPTPSNSKLAKLLSIYSACPDATKFFGTACYIGLNVFNMGARLLDYDDMLVKLWSLNKTSDRAEFNELF